nr:ribonuclease H-like domain, reverse transcriptase, RNA-dependent DNA polymerase [Tanacetum cinerariifolium]
SQKANSDSDDEPYVLIIHSTPTLMVPIVNEATTQNDGTKSDHATTHVDNLDELAELQALQRQEQARTEEADLLRLAFPSLNLILGVGSASIGSFISAGSTPLVFASSTPPMSPYASPIFVDRHSISAGKSHVSTGRPTGSAGRPVSAGRLSGSADRTPVPAGRILGKFTVSASSKRFPRASSVENPAIHDGLKIFDCPKACGELLKRRIYRFDLKPFLTNSKEKPNLISLSKMSDHKDESSTEENAPPNVVPQITTNIVLKGNRAKSMTTDNNGNLKIRPPVTTEEHQHVQREEKARTILPSALPDEHMGDFYHMIDAMDIWNAIKARFEPRSLENFGMIAGIKIESDANLEGEVVSANDAIPAGVSVSARNVAAVVQRFAKKNAEGKGILGRRPTGKPVNPNRPKPVSTGQQNPVSVGRPSGSADRIPVPAGCILGKFTASASSERFPRDPSVENSNIHDGLKIFDCPKSGIFTYSSYDEEFSGPDANNLESSLDVHSTITKRIHNIHLTSQVLGDINSPIQTRSQFKHKGSSEKEPTIMAHALTDPNWVEAMQAEMQQFWNQKVWVLVTLPDVKQAIGTK